MTGLEIAAIAKAIPGLVQLGAGIFKKKPDRPEYTIPPSILKATQLAGSRAGASKMIGYDSALANIEAGTANAAEGIREAGSGAAGVLGNLASVYERGMGNVRNLDVQSGQIQDAAIWRAVQQNNILGQQEMNKMTWDNLDNYITEMMRKQALTGAGIQNTMSAGSDFLGMQMWKSLYPEFGSQSNKSDSSFQKNVVNPQESLKIGRPSFR